MDRPLLVGVLLGVLVATAAVAGRLDYVPYGDTAEYADCIATFLREGGLARLSCAAHPTAFWAAWTSAGVALLGANPLGTAAPWLLGLCATLAAASRAWSLAGAGPAVRVMGAVVLAVQPALLASLVSWAPDTALNVLTLPFLLALAAGATPAAVVLAAALALTKEPGWAIVGLPCFALAAAGGRANRVRSLAPAGVAAALALAWLLGRPEDASMHPTTGKTGVLWQGTDLSDVLERLGSGQGLGVAASFCLSVGVLQFGWVLSPFAAVALARRVPAAFRPGATTLDRLALAWASLLPIAPLFALLPVYFLPRYVAFLLPGLVVLAVDGALRAVASTRVVLVGLFVMAALWSVSSTRTVDPVSRRLFGTFPFGEHALLYMTRWSADWHGPGHETLAYNFEHLQAPRLIDLALADLRPSPDTVFLLPPGASWRVLHRLDPETGTRTWPSEGTVPARVIGEVLNPYDAVSGPVIGFAMPNAPEGDFAALMARWATPERMRRYEMDGYWIDVYVGTGTGAPPPR